MHQLWVSAQHIACYWGTEFQQDTQIFTKSIAEVNVPANLRHLHQWHYCDALAYMHNQTNSLHDHHSTSQICWDISGRVCFTRKNFIENVPLTTYSCPGMKEVVLHWNSARHSWEFEFPQAEWGQVSFTINCLFLLWRAKAANCEDPGWVQSPELLVAFGMQGR